ncbi:MAG TPA: hypothetical protein VNU02_18710, partial [Candidatus Dormibacteraeota bacterium]|nr:hypothetical protein [Candidatus Dormibacteraeota bacterium]
MVRGDAAGAGPVGADRAGAHRAAGAGRGARAGPGDAPGRRVRAAPLRAPQGA